MENWARKNPYFITALRMCFSSSAVICAPGTRHGRDREAPFRQEPEGVGGGEQQVFHRHGGWGGCLLRFQTREGQRDWQAQW